MRRFRALLAAVLAVAGLLAAPAPLRADDTAAALLAKHKAYVGWEFGDGTIRTLRVNGKRTTAAADGTAKIAARWMTVEAGPIFRWTGAYGDYGFTGSVFWVSDENGFTHPDYSPYRTYEVSRMVLFGEATSALAGTMRAPVTIDGTSYPVVRVEPPHGVPIDLAVDPATGAYRRAVVDPGGNYQTTFDIVAYADVLPGKRAISQYRTGTSPALNELTYEPNVSLTTDDFHPPQQVASWDFANPNPFPIEVNASGIYVNATVNGVPGRFLLDTGASEIALDSSFAARAHVVAIRPSSASGIGTNVIRTEITRVDALSIGGNTLHDVRVATGDFGWYEHQETNANHDGLIGYPLFAGAVVRLDTGGKTMTIADPQTATVDRSSGYAVLVDLSTQQPIVPVVIDGNINVNGLMDSGNATFVLISRDLVTQRHIPIVAAGSYNSDDPLSKQTYYQSHMVIEGVGGREEVPCSTISSIAIGPIDYQSTQACVSRTIGSDSIILGYDFLRQFDYVFDYREGLIMMKPHAQ